MPDDKGTLLTALLAFQADAPHIGLDSTNPHFKSRFASLPEILKIVRPRLAELGLVWTTRPSCNDNGQPTLKYKLAHAASGEYEQDEMLLMPAKQDPQAMGSAITYARRYALLATLNLVGDEDDDGNKASQPPPARVTVTKDQAQRIGALRANVDDNALRGILADIGVTAGEDVLAVLPSLSADQAIRVIGAMERHAATASDVDNDPSNLAPATV